MQDRLHNQEFLYFLVNALPRLRCNKITFELFFYFVSLRVAIILTCSAYSELLNIFYARLCILLISK